ncbi:MAG: SAM-dependent methyltransferase [Chloroflexi bacterium]|nr:SAM-dependent methyltransferase [Chloroflexota bacterium]MBV9603138.1 SAM-dependent methyltransferase [Chloroflexota bacterium]
MTTGRPRRFNFRTDAEVAALLEGLDLVPRRVVYLPLWPSEVDDILLEQPERSANYGGMGIKR